MAETFITGEAQVDGIKIKNIVNVFYDKTTDIIIVAYEARDGTITQRHYGAKAQDLPDLLERLQEYWRGIHGEREKTFKAIWARMDRAQEEGLTE